MNRPICMNDLRKQYCGCEGNYQMDSCPYGLLQNNQCRNSVVIKCCIEKCKTELDLVIIMDSSGSIGEPDFKKEKDFVKTLISSLEIGNNYTQVAIINYNSNADIVVDFSVPSTKQSLLNIVDRIKYSGGNTNTAEALKFANEKVLVESKGMRPNSIPKLVIVITDGESNVNPQNTIPYSNKIKARDIKVISVGVGPGIKLQELLGIASSPDDQYFVSDFNQIITLISGLSRASCTTPAVIETEQEITSVVEQNIYKYYKFNLLKPEENDTLNKTYLENFTIELKQLNGTTNLFFSFNETNPKSPTDFVQQNKPPEYDSNFIEIPSNKSNLFSFSKFFLQKNEHLVENRASDNQKSKFYQISRPKSGQNEYVYLSVKGLDQLNEFQVYVYNRTVNSHTSIHKTFSINIFIGVFAFNIFMFIL